MTDRPIIFSGPMVRALLAGTKTQTRRILPPDLQAAFDRAGEGIVRRHPKQQGIGWDKVRRMWVREAWAHDGPDLETVRARFEDALGGAGYGPYYRATETAPDTLSWRSPIHMPRWASRLTLTVTEVRIQRLQDISEEDARAEGAPRLLMDDDGGFYEHGDGQHRIGFAGLWSHLHGPASWDANPWVAAISFTATPANIDSLPEQP